MRVDRLNRGPYQKTGRTKRAREQRLNVSDYTEGNTDKVTGCVKSSDPTVSSVCVSLDMGSCPSK